MTLRTAQLLPTDLDRFHRFRITDDLLDLHQIHTVTDREAREDCGIHFGTGDLSGVVLGRCNWSPDIEKRGNN